MSTLGLCLCRFKVLIGWVLIAVDLHVGHMALLGRHCLIHFDEALAVWRPLRVLPQQNYADDGRCQQRYAGERQRYVDASIPSEALVVWLSTY